MPIAWKVDGDYLIWGNMTFTLQPREVLGLICLMHGYRDFVS